MNNTPKTQWLTLAQAAERLGVSTTTLGRWIAAGKVKSWQPMPKGTHRVSVATVNALLAEWSGNPPTAA